MRRGGKRRRIARGVYADDYGISAIVSVPGRKPKWIRFPPDTPIKAIREKVESERKDLRERTPAKPGRNTLAFDAERYKTQIQHLASWKEAWCEVKAWVKLYGGMGRRALTAAHVRMAMGTFSPRRSSSVAIESWINFLRTSGSIFCAEGLLITDWVT